LPQFACMSARAKPFRKAGIIRAGSRYQLI
jgi:hypothetical protein